MLGPDATDADDDAIGGWAQGYGIVVPDVARYADVLRPMPDALVLAMRNLATDEGLAIIDAPSALAIALLARTLRPRRVLEVGTGIGSLTLYLARAVPAECLITSVESDPALQERAHAFLERDELHRCAVELRLGDPLRVLREGAGSSDAQVDLLVLSDAAAPRMELYDMLAPRVAQGGLVVIPHALREGRVADPAASWGGDAQVDDQRMLNRLVATDPRFEDVLLLPIGDGVLVACRS